MIQIMPDVESENAEEKRGDGVGNEEKPQEKKLTKRQIRIMEERKKRDQSESDISESSDDNDGGGEKIGTYDMLKKAMRDGAQAFARSFVDYGPPYFPHEDGEELEPCPVVDCVSEMNMSYVKLHRLLNARCDPNIPDPDDFYQTAMHYAGRHLHFLAARMMRRAGADVNVVNEWGQSPLMLVIINVVAHERDPRRGRQLKMMNWLIEQGANVQLRDKGGYECLDFACMNNDLQIIKILMDKGAKVRRDNYSLVAKRETLLEKIADPEVYRFILEHLKEEEEHFGQKEELRKKIRDLEEHDRQAAKNLSSLAKRKEDKLRKQKEALAFERKLEKESRRNANVAASMHSLTKGKKAKDAQFGEWKPDDTKNWHWEGRSTQKSADEMSATIHSKSINRMKTLEKKNRKSIYNERWQKMGGSAAIEVPWKRSAPFEMEGVTDQKDEKGSSEDDDSDELNERDENDDMLDGEDLGEVLDDLVLEN